MAVGDVVGEIYSTTTTFQPAAGVTISITQFMAVGGNARIYGKGSYDTGANAISYASATSDSNSIRLWQNQKQCLFLDNTRYLEFSTGGTASTYSGFTGIQIQ